MTNKVRAERVVKWIKALRSGKYKQGRNRLATLNEDKAKTGYCCLGLACEVNKLHYNGDDGLLSLAHKRALGLITCSGDYGHRTLVDDNDTARRTFKKIADMILVNKDQLFTSGVAKLITLKPRKKIKTKSK